MINFEISTEEAKHICEILNITSTKEVSSILKKQVTNIDNILEDDYSLWNRLDNLLEEGIEDDS